MPRRVPGITRLRKTRSMESSGRPRIERCLKRARPDVPLQAIGEPAVCKQTIGLIHVSYLLTTLKLILVLYIFSRTFTDLQIRLQCACSHIPLFKMGDSHD